MEVAGKNIIITGGGSGMGAETARHLASKGANIVILDRDQASATQVAESIKGRAFACDVTQEKKVLHALEEVKQTYGDLHGCINCAGIAPAKRIVGKQGPMPLEDFEQVISINLIGTFNVLRLVAAMMVHNVPVGSDQERGVIINTASIAAYEGQIGQSAYSASKGAICGLTLPAARELSQFGIRVMTIAPGLFQTPLLEGLPEDIQISLASNIPFPKRLGATKEYALLAEQIIINPYLNGEVIRLDAGLRMQPK